MKALGRFAESRSLALILALVLWWGLVGSGPSVAQQQPSPPPCPALTQATPPPCPYANTPTKSPDCHPYPQPRPQASQLTTTGNTTTVCTGLGIFPEPELDPFTKPPGTNFLATIYTNMFDGKGHEMPNTLPSTPTIPYHLHDGPPVVSQINPASPTTDLSSVFVLVARKACQNLSPLPPALAQYCQETEDLARDRANELKEVASTLLGVRDLPDGPPESIIDAILQQISLEKTTQIGLDILEGNPLEPRAYSGLPLLHYKGPDKIKKVTRTTDKDGNPMGTVNVHQVWYDSHIESDTAFIDQSEAMDIPWTITYTVDVLSRGNDDFSPFVMYFDAPGNENPWMPGPPHIGMDQTFFPMEDGTRNIFKIKMTLGKYQNLIYTWGWRIHPTRVQVIEGALKHYSYQGSDPKFTGQNLSLPEWEMMAFGGRTPEQIAKFGHKTTEQAIAMIGEASPAKVMWTDLREAQDAVRQGDYRRVVARMIEAQDAFGDWRDRTQLPQGTLLLVTASDAAFITQLGTLKNKTSPLLWYTPGKSFQEESPWNSRTRSSRCSLRRRNPSRAVPDGCLWPAPSKNWGPVDNGARSANSGGAV